MKLLKINTLLLSLIIALLVLPGCRKKEGTFEKAGDRADEIIDNIKDGDPPLHKKGAMEKAGEAVDDAVDDVK